MADSQSLNERAGSLNFDNCSIDSSPNYRRNSRIRNIACLILVTFVLITFVSILVIGITHNSHHHVVKPNSTRLNLSSTDSQLSRINITVYYEVYSVKSRDLIAKQLAPVQQKYSSYVNIRYTAFGKVTISKEIQGNYHYECRHGQLECHAAQLHVCLQQRFSNNTDSSTLTTIMACSISKYNFSGTTVDTLTKITADCVSKYAQDESTQELFCSNAESLIIHNHNEAMLLKPQLKFMPTVIVDGIQMSDDQMFREMDTIVCRAIKEQIEINC